MDFKNLKWYRAGKITVLNGAQVVNGTNTNWLEADIKPGDAFYTANGRAYEVENVLTSEQLTIKEPYQGDTVVSGDYKIIRRVPAVMQAEIANRPTPTSSSSPTNGRFSDSTSASSRRTSPRKRPS